MPDYRFKLDDEVVVEAHGEDVGGTGRVTGRESTEDNRGERILYRVLIVDHVQQVAIAAEKKRENKGFWYADKRVLPAKAGSR